MIRGLKVSSGSLSVPGPFGLIPAHLLFSLFLFFSRLLLLMSRVHVLALSSLSDFRVPHINGCGISRGGLLIRCVSHVCASMCVRQRVWVLIVHKGLVKMP